MSLSIRPMSEAEYEAWRPAAVASFAAEVVDALRMTPEEADAKATGNFVALLPEGRDTPFHDLCMIEEDGRAVGHVWLAEERTDGRDRLYIYSLLIDELERGRGLAREVMVLVEETARARGLRRIELNVWPSNHVARALYRSFEFEEATIGMVKILE